MNDIEYHLYEEAKAGRMTRQQLLVRGSLLGISVTAMSSILAACGSSSSSGSSGAASGGGSGTITRGGTFNLGVTQPAQDVDPVTMYNEGAIATANIAGSTCASRTRTTRSTRGWPRAGSRPPAARRGRSRSARA